MNLQGPGRQEVFLNSNVVELGYNYDSNTPLDMKFHEIQLRKSDFVSQSQIVRFPITCTTMPPPIYKHFLGGKGETRSDPKAQAKYILLPN